MKLLIAVPSKGRAERIMEDTLSWLDMAGGDWSVFVEPQEYDAYLKAGVPPIFLEKLDKNGQGLMYAKQFIQRYAQDNGYDVVFKIDDDVRGWVGRSRKFVSQFSLEVFEAIVRDGMFMFEKHPNLFAIGFPYSHQMFNVGNKWSVNARLQSCYMVRTEHLCPDPRIEVFEDFATFIKIRVLGGDTVRYNFAGINCRPVGKGKGGLQAFTDRKEQAERSAQVLQEIYPALKFRKVEGKAWEWEPDMRDTFLGKSTH
jgi:hypothetical protein